jgi:uncharacterized protein (TIGR03437 family)
MHRKVVALAFITWIGITGQGLFFSSALMYAQPSNFSVPVTYFLGSGVKSPDPYGRSSATPRAVTFGPEGDIWGAGVALGNGLPAQDPEERSFNAGLCLSGPLTNPFFVDQAPCTDLFAVRLAPDGTGARFVKYLGSLGMDEMAGLAVDMEGSAFVTGTRASSPTAYPADEPYLIKLTRDGSTVYDLPLPSFVRPTGIDVDAQGAVYIAGFVSGDAHETNGLGLGLIDSENGVILKLDGHSRELQYLVLLGGSAYDRIEGLTVDDEGRVYVAGETESADLSVTLSFASDPPGASRDVFVAALSPTGDHLEWLATLGGSERESNTRIELTADGRIVITGTTRSADLPLRDARIGELLNQEDCWFAAIDIAGPEWLSSDYLGLDEIHDVASDAEGVVFLAGSRSIEQEGGSKRSSVIARLNPDGGRGEDLAAGALAIASAPDGGLIAAGETRQGVLDPSGMQYGAQAAYFALLLSQAPSPTTPWLAAVLHAGDNVPAALSPGMVVSLYGSGLGPVQGLAASPEGGRFPAELGGVRVLIAGKAATLLYVSEGQVNAVAPFDLGDQSIWSVVVEYNGVTSNVSSMTAADASPAPFLQGPPRDSYIALLNEDGTLNSPANPARVGSTVAMWTSGMGRFSAPLLDGVIVEGDLPALESEIEVDVFGIPAQVRYAGAAPGLVAGVAQVNFVIPAGAENASRVWIRIRAGERESWLKAQIATSR